MTELMKAKIFIEPGQIILGEKPVPVVGPLDALIKVTTGTICGTDVHILMSDCPVEKRADHWLRAGWRDRKIGISCHR